MRDDFLAIFGLKSLIHHFFSSYMSFLFFIFFFDIVVFFHIDMGLPLFFSIFSCCLSSTCCSVFSQQLVVAGGCVADG